MFFAEIQCTPGYDGGLPQVFVLELVSKRTGTRRFNFSNKNEPFFVLDRLEKLSALMTLENNSLSCVVYAINQKGRSTPVLIQDFEIGRIQPYRAGKWPPPSTLKNVQMLRRHSSRKKNCSKDSNDDEPEPDVIPAQFNMVSCTPLIATPQHTDAATRDKDAHQYGGFTSPPATYQMGTIVDHHPAGPQQDTALEYRTHGSIVGILPTARTAAAGAAAELDINVIKDRLLTTRVPESCV
uniref:Uncharacterized protein n=1 Tax=Anopheles quadriannulatus TaxID=34691 RepID=A0A182XCI0_ANOQN